MKFVKLLERVPRRKLLWVPSEHQVADGFTKCGKSSEFRKREWCVKLHESALRRSSQKKICANVNSVDCKLAATKPARV